MHCISTIPTDHLIALCAPVEPVCFVSCDGPHSGVPDDQRPPHWLDVLAEGLASSRLAAIRSAEYLADVWAGYGFTAADLAAWVEAGITEPAAAAECRTEGFNPHEPSDCGFLSTFAWCEADSTWAQALVDGDATAEQAMAAYKGAP